MNRHNLMVLAVIWMFGLSSFIFWGMIHRKNLFQKTVHESLKTTEGYDTRFIDMVNRLEKELANRATFSYTGRKDPMTGRLRAVVQASTKRFTGKKDTDTYVDPMRLTAIIYQDDEYKYTAIVMYDERSFSVEVGDQVVGRDVVSITRNLVTMQDSARVYSYYIDGNRQYRQRYSKEANNVDDES